jgi:bifunctional UDP-N-acetylglucosamine pyrophosphorylase/glucosamine-1-phosphate N-acetyltransferase
VAEDQAVLVLAAGKGTRMKSGLIKVLHPLMGQPMLAHVINSARYLEPSRIVVVVGHQSEDVRSAFAGWDVDFALQTEQLGTGHAVASAGEAFDGFSGTILILSGDVPLLSPQTMADFLAAHRQSNVPISVLTVALVNPGAYGRVIRDEDGYLWQIVEARDATPEELQVNEINSGIYAVDAELLFKYVNRLKPENDQKEYYLTDIVGEARKEGHLVAAILCPDPDEVMGINDRAELAEAVELLKARTNQAWMRAGVTMIDPLSTYVETAVKLAPDVTIWPGACLLGRTMVGSGSVIGPNAYIKDAVIGTGVRVEAGSVVQSVEVADGMVVNPLTVLGPGD